MFIIHGTYDRKRTQGFVAEFCRSCNRVQPFKVNGNYLVSHVYFVPLGKGKLKSTFLQCSVCAHEVTFRKGNYDELVAESVAKNLELSELLQRSNERLVSVLSLWERASQLPDHGEGKYLGVSRDAVKTTLASLVECYQNPDCEQYLGRIERWMVEGREDGHKLLSEIEGLVDWRQSQDQAMVFAKKVSQKIPESAHFIPSLFLSLAAFLLFCFLAVAFEKVPVVSLSLVFGGFVLSVFLFVWLYRAIGRWRMRRWYRKKVLPQLQDQQISLPALISVLEDETTKKSPETKLARMAKNIHLLRQILEEETPERFEELAESQRAF